MASFDVKHERRRVGKPAMRADAGAAERRECKVGEPRGASARWGKGRREARGDPRLEDDTAAARVEQLQWPLAGDVRVREHANRGEHREAAVVELLGLVAVPRRVYLPLARAEEIARLVVGAPAVEDADHLHEHDESEDLEPPKLGHLRRDRRERLGHTPTARGTVRRGRGRV